MNRETRTILRLVQIVLTCSMALLLSAVVLAETVADPAKATLVSSEQDNRLPIYREGWQFFIAPYIWVGGSNQNITKQGSNLGTTKIDLPWYDLVPKLFSTVFGAMGRVEVWNGKWGVFAENLFMYLGDTVSGTGHKQINAPQLPVPLNLTLSGRAKVIIRQGGLDVGGRYLLATVPLGSAKQTPVLSFELLGGLRYVWYNQFTGLGFNATLAGPEGRALLTRAGSSGHSLRLSVVGPFLGIRTGLWLTEKLDFLAKAEIGEFGIVGNDYLDCILEATVGYQVQKHTRIYLGYRALYYTFDTGSVKSHGWYSGPMLGAVFNF
ncbi:MAG: hypothetical protein WC600_03905 [Desulfobaccales bacterium]